MDLDVQHVWLRSRPLDAYLHATPDGTGVCLRRTRESMNAAWVLHGIPGDPVHMLLQSAAYCRYLAGTGSRAPWCQGGGFRTVLIKHYDRAAHLHNILWEFVLREGYLRLRNVGGTRYLRANGRYFRCFNGWYLPWNTGVTVQDRGTTTHWDWDVEAIPLTPHFPGIPDPINEPIPGSLAIMLVFQRLPWRLIRFVQAADDGSYNQQVNDWTVFQFTGNSIFRLRNEVAYILHTNDTHIIMFVRAGRHGRLTPMLVDLPHNGRLHLRDGRRSCASLPGHQHAVDETRVGLLLTAASQ